MQFQVECFENVDAFGTNSPILGFRNTEDFANAPLRRVHSFVVVADSAVGAAEATFAIANAPWEPDDVNGETWDHQRVRSMSVGDVVVVHTPDGPVAYGCSSFSWALLPPDMLPAGVEA